MLRGHSMTQKGHRSINEAGAGALLSPTPRRLLLSAMRSERTSATTQKSGGCFQVARVSFISSACVYSDVDEFIILSFSRWWRADGGRGTGCLDRVSPRRVRRLSRGRHAQGRRGVSLTVKSFAGWLLNALFFFRMKLLGIYHYLFF